MMNRLINRIYDTFSYCNFKNCDTISQSSFDETAIV